MTDLETFLLRQAYETIDYLQGSLESDLNSDYSPEVDKLENAKILLEELGHKP